MKKIIVLGAGLTGKEIAIELSKKFDVTCSDIQLCSLEILSPTYSIDVIPCNFKDKNSLRELIHPFDLVINAVASSIGFETLKTIIEEKKNVVNLSVFSEDIFCLDELAARNNVSVINYPSVPKLFESFSASINLILEEAVPRKGILNMEGELITD